MYEQIELFLEISRRVNYRAKSMTVTAQAAVDLVRIQTMHPQFRYSFRLHDDKPLVSAHNALEFSQALWHQEKPDVAFWPFVEGVMGKAAEAVDGA